MKITWRDLLLMAGIEAPIWWSGHKNKKVFKQLEIGDMSYLKEVRVNSWNVFGIEATALPSNEVTAAGEEVLIHEKETKATT